jgi:hypothetical protein
MDNEDLGGRMLLFVALPFTVSRSRPRRQGGGTAPRRPRRSSHRLLGSVVTEDWRTR